MGRTKTWGRRGRLAEMARGGMSKTRARMWLKRAREGIRDVDAVLGGRGEPDEETYENLVQVLMDVQGSITEVIGAWELHY